MDKVLIYGKIYGFNQFYSFFVSQFHGPQVGGEVYVYIVILYIVQLLMEPATNII